MRLLHSHPVGSQFVRQALRAFEDAGVLKEFWTTVARGEVSVLDRFLPHSIVMELRRRSYDAEILLKTSRMPARELMRLASGRLGLKKLVSHEVGPFSYDSVAQGVDYRVATRLKKGGIDTIYAYEDSALQSFRVGKEMGIQNIYELPIGHWRLGRKIFSEEAERYPEWAPTLEGLKDSEHKLRKKDEEVQLADKIIVPSHFVAESLHECPSLDCPVQVINYGCPPPVSTITPSDSGPLRVLFVGSLGARKGLHYALEAVKNLNIELTIIGSMPNKSCLPLESELGRHRYLGSIPRQRVLEEMARSEVFLFPTLFEGLANVLLESISQGLVPVTTANSGATGLIADGHDGFIVPIRDVSAIQERLELLISDRNLLFEMRQRAIKKATLHSWDRYRINLKDHIVEDAKQR